MKKSRTRMQRVLRWLLWSVAVLVLLIAAVPVWFPWVTRPILGRYGLSYGHYDRMGGNRFLLSEVKGEWGRTHFQADKVECVLPTTWLWRRVFPNRNREPGMIISNGLLTIGVTTNALPAGARKVHSTFSTLDRVDRIGLGLQRLLPVAQLTNCAIMIRSTRLSLPRAEWRDGRLHARVLPSFAQGAVELDAQFASASSLALSLAWKQYNAVLHGRFIRKPIEWNWTGELRWLTNSAALSAKFATNGWWPDHANMEVQQVRVPASLLRMKGYQDLKTTVALGLVSNQFDLSLTCFALPSGLGSGRMLPPLEAALHARGNPNSVTVEQLHVQAPWLRADLTNTISIKRTREWLANAARLQVALDLDKVPGVSIKGKASGEVSIELNEEHQPVALFDLAASRIGAWGREARTVGLHGAFAWPVLKLDAGTINLDDGSQFWAKGQFDFAAMKLVNADWRCSGPFLQEFLPGFNYASLTASGSAHGTPTNLTHLGQIRFEQLQGGLFKPLEVKATWKGEGLKLSSAGIDLAAADSRLTVSGQFDLSAFRKHEMAGTIKNASLYRHDELLYGLQQPCAIAWRMTPADQRPSEWTLTMDDFRWLGGEKELFLSTRLDWPSRASVRVKARRAELADFADFVKIGVSNLAIGELELNAHWSNGPVQLFVAGAVTATNEQGRGYAIKGRLDGGDTLKIQDLTVHSDFAPALNIQGTIPLQAVPSRGKDWLVTMPKTPITLRANLLSSEEMSFKLGSRGRLKITAPQLQAEVSGTLESPSAALSLGADSVNWQRATNSRPVPSLNQLKLVAKITPNLIALRQLTANVDGQPIEATGAWPLSAGAWRELWVNKTLPDWKRASGHLQIPKARIAALAQYLPRVFAPEGRLMLDLSLAPGGKLNGSLALTNAATRPLGKLAPLRDIAASIKLTDWQAVLDTFDAEMGGQPVRASGRVALPIGSPLDYRLHLQAGNVPLARSLEFLLRGDLNLMLQGEGQSPPTLSGDVTLRNGLYVRYASDLLWSGPRRPELQPPYFNVTNQPFADWKLRLNIKGDRFLRVRIPVFDGIVSGNVKLSGTLGEPVVTGDARIDSGRVDFPFGTLQVDEGYASLTENNPHGPTLQIHAAGRTLNYDVQLEVTGPADGANVIFSSTPPLNSDEILLMLTAGEVPQNQYTFSTEAKAGRLASFLGKDLFRRFSGAGAAEQRLTINSGEGISEEGKLTYSVEYRLTDRWSIIGEYDRFNAFNANLKWNILSR